MSAGNERIDAVCTRCGESKRPVVRVMKSDGAALEGKLCKHCGQPMKPKGVKKRPFEYNHAQGCPYSHKREAK